MLVADSQLDDDGRAYKRARMLRRNFQGVVSIALLVTIALVAVVGVERLVSAYAFMAMWLGFNEAQRRVLRHVGETTNVEVSSEMARVAPFAALVSYVIAWIGAGELLLGTGALPTPFPDALNYALSGALVAAALAATWRSRDSVLHDRLAAFTWFALLLPTRASSPRTAWWALSIGRVVIVLGTHLALMSSSELLISTSKLHSSLGSDDRLASLASVTRVASNNAARKLAQSAWILVAWPPLIIVGGIGVVALNEYIGAVSPRHSRV